MTEQEVRGLILAIASEQVGVKEEPAGSNVQKYGEHFGLNGLPWCMIAVSWIYEKAGLSLGQDRLEDADFEKGFASCRAFLAYAERNKWITDKPVAGDIALFKFNSRVANHAGIFQDFAGDGFLCFEGNTGSKSENNGGEFMRRWRKTDSAIFVHVPFE